MGRLYYGIRYLNQNRRCTTGYPHPITGRMSIACDVKVFHSKEGLETWLSEEKLGSYCGSGGGERIKATKKMCREHCLGTSVANFEEELKYDWKSL